MQGIEPWLTGWKPVVLPLHHICIVLLYTSCLYNKIYKPSIFLPEIGQILDVLH